MDSEGSVRENHSVSCDGERIGVNARPHSNSEALSKALIRQLCVKDIRDIVSDQRCKISPLAGFRCLSESVGLSCRERFEHT